MSKAYITIIHFKQSGVELGFGTIASAVEWINKKRPYLKVDISKVWSAKLSEGNIFDLDEITIRNIKVIK